MWTPLMSRQAGKDPLAWRREVLHSLCNDESVTERNAVSYSKLAEEFPTVSPTSAKTLIGNYTSTTRPSKDGQDFRDRLMAALEKESATAKVSKSSERIDIVLGVFDQVRDELDESSDFDVGDEN